MAASRDNFPPRGERQNIFASANPKPRAVPTTGARPVAVFSAGAAAVAEPLPAVGLDRCRPRFPSNLAKPLGRIAVTTVLALAGAGVSAVVVPRVWVATAEHPAAADRRVDRHPRLAPANRAAQAVPEAGDVGSAKRRALPDPRRRHRHHARPARPSTPSPAPSSLTLHPPAARPVPRPVSPLPVPSAPRAPARPAPVSAGAPPEFF